MFELDHVIIMQFQLVPMVELSCNLNLIFIILMYYNSSSSIKDSNINIIMSSNHRFKVHSKQFVAGDNWSLTTKEDHPCLRIAFCYVS